VTAPVRLATPASIRWCQDTGRVLVIDEQTGLAASLTGLDAAAWKWFGLSYQYADVLKLAQVFLGLPEEETRARLNQTLTRWVELGLLAEEKLP